MQSKKQNKYEIDPRAFFDKKLVEKCRIETNYIIYILDKIKIMKKLCISERALYTYMDIWLNGSGFDLNETFPHFTIGIYIEIDLAYIGLYDKKQETMRNAYLAGEAHLMASQLIGE